MKKRYFFLIAFVMVLIVFASFSFSAEFWGSAKSNKYHYPTCRWAQKIKSSNLVKFASPEEATKAGYIPCKVCKPPLPQKSGTKKIGNVSIAKIDIIEELQRRGCCSWHGGVCGCDQGTRRVICCDGTLSPSCT